MAVEANPYALRQILSQERRYVIPTFQRDYEWTLDGQWRLLFDDLEQVAERLDAARNVAWMQGEDLSRADKKVGPHFLGAIVLDQLPSPAGGLDVRAVIDGQQRLTTIQLLLGGLAEALTQISSPRLRQVERLLHNPEDVVDNPDERHKLWPRRRDREVWREVMSGGPVNGSHPYCEARRYFLRRSLEFIGAAGDKEQRASLLMDAALDLFKLVVIDLEENDDAQVIFEVLNGRQTPLTAADLVKNLLFLRAENKHEGDLEELYDKYWSQFDDPWWTTEVGRGHAARRHTDMLLASWLTATSEEDASPSRLYGQIRAYLNLSGASIAETLAEISRFAREYRVITGVETEPHRRTREAYTRLNSLGVTTALPLLIWLRTLPSSTLPEGRHAAAVVAVESFVIRRSLVGAQTRGYGQIFAEVLATTKAIATQGGDVVGALCAALSANAQSRGWPTDSEIEDAFLTRRFYGVDSTQRIRMVFGALDQYFRESDRKMEAATFDYDVLTIEHIMPQSWKEHWPLPDGLGEADSLLASQRRDAMVDHLGNLTLVSGALNPAMSNDSWLGKRAALVAHSALAWSSDLVTQPVWDEHSIDARALDLAKAAQKVWPGPQGHSGDAASKLRTT